MPNHKLKQTSLLAASFLSGMLAASSTAYSGTMGAQLLTPDPVQIYLGVFGGYGSTSGPELRQFGTALYREAIGGPLAVNALGSADRVSSWFIGGHAGYRWQRALNQPWSVNPLVEIEAIHFSPYTLSGTAENHTERLEEHRFIETVPTKLNVFLVNFILEGNADCGQKWHPYLGFGIGSGLASVRNVDALQVAPPEVGVNHFSAVSNDNAVAVFAAQPKLGLRFDINDRVDVFVDYRWLYTSSQRYNFGSTTVSGHSGTTDWRMIVGSQGFNMGSIGVNVHI